MRPAARSKFLRAWRFRDSLKGEAGFRPWLYRIVVNTCNSSLRREVPHRDRRCNDDALEQHAVSRDPLARVGEVNDVAAAVRALPIALRVVVVLRYYADMRERDIAVAISRPVGTVKSRLNAARQILAAHPALRTNEPPSPPLTQENPR